jgi:predicted RNase H-like HicB family nuclease
VRTLSYAVIFEPQPEGGYTVHVRRSPVASARARPSKRPREVARDAIKTYCESLVADGEPLPPDLAVPPRNERLQVSLAT